jgi:hypothetical protein
VRPAFVAGTGAPAREAAAEAGTAAPPRPEECTEEIGPEPRGQLDVDVVTRRVQARATQTAWPIALRREHAARRVAEVLGWPAGRACPLGRLREAWVAYGYGLDAVTQGGSIAAGPSLPGASGRAACAISIYEAFADRRPPDWPATGPAALCAIASLGGPATLAGGIGLLLVLAKGMRAAVLEHDVERLQRAAARARRRRAGAASPIDFRAAAARWETAEQRRRRVRDAVLAAGANPVAWPNAELARRWLTSPPLGADEPQLVGRDTFAALDGVDARAERYRAELDNGRWQLPPGWPHTLQPTTEEASFA